MRPGTISSVNTDSIKKMTDFILEFCNSDYNMTLPEITIIWKIYCFVAMSRLAINSLSNLVNVLSFLTCWVVSHKHIRSWNGCRFHSKEYCWAELDNKLPQNLRRDRHLLGEMKCQLCLTRPTWSRLDVFSWGKWHSNGDSVCPFETGERLWGPQTQGCPYLLPELLDINPIGHSEKDEGNPEKVCFVVQTGERLQPPLWKWGISHPLSGTRAFCVLVAVKEGMCSIHTEQLEEKH